MLGRLLSLVAALLLACASTSAHGYARPLQPESAHRGFATAVQGAQRDRSNVTPEAASENYPVPVEASDGRRFYAKARYYGAGRGSFISVDPWDGDTANPVSLNKYLYGHANPGVYVDPDGRCAGPLIFLCLGAIGAELGFFGSVISQEITEGKNLATVDYKRAGTEGVIGGVSGATGAGFVAAGVRTSLAVAGGVATDTLLSTGGDAINAPPGEFVAHESLQTNLVVSTAGVFAGTAGGLLVDAGRDVVTQGWKYASRVRSGEAMTVREAPTGNSADSFYDPAMADEFDLIDRPAGRGTDVAHSPQIEVPFGAGIGKQGYAYENALAANLPARDRLPKNFKTFDFFDRQSGHATSAKTLDTTTNSRINDPRRLYSDLRKSVDAAADFEAYELGSVDFSSADIVSRTVRVAVPLETNAAQWAQIQRAIEYANERGVRLTPEAVTNAPR